MSKYKTITIDLSKWQTQAEAAKVKGCSIQYINKLIKLGKLQAERIPELNLVLVQRIG